MKNNVTIETLNTAMGIFNDPLFKALQEPVRIEILKHLMVLGKADIKK